MEERFKNLINAIKQNKLTSSEKSEMFKKINAFIDYNAGKTHSSIFYHVSPFVFRSPFVMAGKMASVLVIILVIGGGSLSYASSESLPGDFLYPVKIHLKEKIEEKFAVGAEKKLALRQKRIETRFGEVETLIKEKKITKEKISLVQSKIEIEKAKASEDLKELKKEDTEKALIAENTIETSIEEHKDAISSLIEPKKEDVSLMMTAPVTEEPIETDFYGDIESDLNITEEDLNILLNSDSNVGENDTLPPLETTDIEILPEPISTDILPPLPENNVNTPTSEIQKETETENN